MATGGYEEEQPAYRSELEKIEEKIKKSEEYLEDLKKAAEWLKQNPGYESFLKVR